LATDLAKEIEKEHSVKAIPVRADISKTEECSWIIDAAKKHFINPETGKLQVDILIHNAAVLYVGPLESVNEKDFHHIYAVNVLGPTFLTAACLPYLPTDRSGRIVMMSSICSKVGTINTTLYAGTKAATEAMARVWCRELSERATVNTINPGPVMTDMYLSAPDEVKKDLALWNPLTPLVSIRETDSPDVRELGEKFGGRPAYAHEISGLVATLCSPDAGWCTGSLISANGGLAFSL
jgi:NAD(P)-dependent dehydrogenase (short-subunit alcohol dehydrogenase family)